MGVQVAGNKRFIACGLWVHWGLCGLWRLWRKELQRRPCPSQSLAFPQFWSAYVPCQTQERDALRLTLEQIDLIHRMCASYSELELVTTVQGGQAGGGVRDLIEPPQPLKVITSPTCPQN